MRKYLFIVTVLFIWSFKTFSQIYTVERQQDSLKLDSLKRALPALEGKEKIDALNAASEMFASIYGFGGFIHRVDSMKLYSEKANQEANKIGYKYGIARSLLGSANSKGFQRIKDSTAKRYIQRAILIGEEIKNDSILAMAYYHLAGFEDEVGNYKKAIQYFERAGDNGTVGEVYTWLSMHYTYNGEYEEAFEYAQKSLELSKKNAHTAWRHELVQWALYNMADLYKAAGDYESAMNCLREAREYGRLHDLEWNMDDGIGELLALMNKPDSSLYYLQNFKRNAPMNQLGADMFIGETYLSMKEYGKAKQLFQYVVDSLKKSKDPFLPFLTRGLINMGKAYAGEKNYKEAFKYTKEGYKIIRYYTDPQFVMETYKLLSVVYHHLGNNDSAYFYLDRYTVLKDSTQNKQFLWRLNNKLNKYKEVAENVKRESQIVLLNKDNKIKQQRLKQQATFRNFIIAAFIALLFAGLYVFRNVSIKRRNERLKQEKKGQEWKLKELASENKQIELQKQSAELEMQALRAQMNPHFIFNSLNSINYFILKNESKTASNYLTRFSRLIRMVLINSQKSLIALQDELEMLRIYLDMERLRFKNSFDYFIVFKNEIDAETVAVPPLILQPFCENAIWHGLMHKEGQGHLTIDLSMANKILECIISDDGVGRERAEEINGQATEKKKSLGLQITRQRLALLNKNENVQTFYTIDDVVDEHENVAGTKVNLKISRQILKEEFA
jgi:tetratricopeptide (TPR) repeat protein